MRYFKRRWDEPRCDEHYVWGHATVLFEVGPDLRITRLMEFYEKGPVMTYDETHPSDRYGGLSDLPIRESDFLPYEISEVEFEDRWRKANEVAGNR